MGMMKQQFMDWFESHEQELYERFVESTTEIKELWESFVEQEHISYVSGDADAQYEMMRDDEIDKAFINEGETK